MDTIDDKALDDLLAPATGTDVDPKHRAWMNDQIRDRLAKINAGETTFKSLKDVRRKFGFDAH